MHPTDDPGASKDDLHNLYRIRCMSDDALQQRIYKIEKRDKLLSFVKVSHPGLQLRSQGGWG